jgi:hypothetical protein
MRRFSILGITKSCLLLLILAFSLTACDKEEDTPTPKTPASAAYNFSGQEGARFSLTSSDGSTQNVLGQAILGWDSGNLLGGAYFRLLRISSEIGTFHLRVNMPNGSNFLDLAAGNALPLTDYALLLQNSAQISSPWVEFYIPNSTNLSGHAQGEVQLMRNQTFADTTYSILGNVDASFNHAGNTVRVEGYFWSVDGW